MQSQASAAYKAVFRRNPDQIGRSGRLIDLMVARPGSGWALTSMPSTTLKPGTPTTLMYAQLSVSDGQPRASSNVRRAWVLLSVGRVNNRLQLGGTGSGLYSNPGANAKMSITVLLLALIPTEPKRSRRRNAQHGASGAESPTPTRLVGPSVRES